MTRNTDDTKYWEFQRPEIGDDWAEAWDHLVQTVDQALIASGTLTDRPEPPGDEDNYFYLATDEKELYRWDGSSWIAQLNYGADDSEGSDHTTVNGISNVRTNVGAMVGGSYHANGYDDGGYGVVFEAEDLYIDSVVVDSDLEASSITDLEIELRQYDEGALDPTVIDSTTVSLSGGPERITLDFHVPAGGDSDADDNNEYMLQRGDSDDLYLRRRLTTEGDWSASDFEDQTYTDLDVDFFRGYNNSASSGPGGDTSEVSWYYFFDWLVGENETRATSPWSTDVGEIYMRPRDPVEEFGEDVGPRALWFDTSE